MAKMFPSTVVSPEQVAQVTAAITAIRTSLPFLRWQEPSDQRSRMRLGERTKAFVDHCLAAAELHPEVLPRNFDVASFQRSQELHSNLVTIRRTLREVMDLVESTAVSVGSDALDDALQVYQSVRLAPADQGLSATAEELGKRFAKASVKDEPAAQA